MIPHLRQQYNQNFRQEQYEAMLDWIEANYAHRPPFHVAETPVFIPPGLKNRLVEACTELTEMLAQPNFKSYSEAALQPGQIVPNETVHPTFLVIDFGICRDEQGELIPQLIEIQGFPSLFFWQNMVAGAYRRFFDIPDNYTHLFGGLDETAYLDTLKRVLYADSEPESTILLEIEPEKQATAIDFLVAKRDIGLPMVCVTQLQKEGRNLYYTNEQGRRIKVERIYNRVIFDELLPRMADLPMQFSFTDDLDVHWVGHPNWFFRISKHTLPFLRNRYVPETHLLSTLDAVPTDLDNYVLKPLFSFAGMGVIMHPTQADIDKISDRSNFILQKKVQYVPIIPTLDDPAKVEVRMLLVWEDGAPRPQLLTNLIRLAKAEMIGVRANKGRTWVGGSVGFFEP
ncbi:MAG TPA: hypothetical protein PKC76_10465 [Saprospiraceae bacterium]|nr:hypothetical protein [Saprospiraceae bacterium]HMP24547.1 hypothetical protein [Saprospiraceae bacterium]